jgi:hypothetical protein
MRSRVPTLVVVVAALLPGVFLAWMGVDLALEFGSSSSVEGVKAAAVGVSTASFAVVNASQMLIYHWAGGRGEFWTSFAGGVVSLVLAWSDLDLVALGVLSLTQVVLVLIAFLCRPRPTGPGGPAVGLAPGRSPVSIVP